MNETVVLVDEEVPHVRFACDLEQCRGACCTMPGGVGAPLLRQERSEIAQAVSVVRKYLPQAHREVIDREGLVVGSLEAPVTPCYQRGPCVYVTFDGGIAKCAFEKAFLAGEIRWRKPLSCHLFPLRSDGGSRHRIRFEYLRECEPAIQRGRSEDVPLWEFLKAPLVRAYGADWYARFVEVCERDHKRTGRDLVV